MAQFHYVVGYDSELNKWFVESDTIAYFSDGNVWYEQQYRESFWGWGVPEEGSHDETLDYHLLNTLQYIVDTFPTPAQQEA